MKTLVRRLLRSIGYDIVAMPEEPRSRCRALGDHAQFLRDLRARGLVPKVILDVGANRGEWSTVAATVFPAASIVMIEPQQEMHGDLERFVHEHPGSILHRVGAGADDTTLPMTIQGGGDGSTFVLTEEEARVANCERRDLPVRRIDGLLAANDTPIPELVKLDIQGFEIQALEGARSLLGTTEVFILEVLFFVPETRNGDFAAVVAFMNDAGYKLYDFCGFLPRSYDNALGAADAVFVKRDGFLRKHLSWY